MSEVILFLEQVAVVVLLICGIALMLVVGLSVLRELLDR